jgi:hypothetical protein
MPGIGPFTLINSVLSTKHSSITIDHDDFDLPAGREVARGFGLSASLIPLE